MVNMRALSISLYFLVHSIVSHRVIWYVCDFRFDQINIANAFDCGVNKEGPHQPIDKHKILIYIFHAWVSFSVDWSVVVRIQSDYSIFNSDQFHWVFYRNLLIQNHMLLNFHHFQNKITKMHNLLFLKPQHIGNRHRNLPHFWIELLRIA